jgi:hypothetical protein
MPHKEKKARVGAGLSLDKLAKSRITKYDKRAVIEKQRQLKLRRRSEYNRLKRKLEAEGDGQQQTKYPQDLQVKQEIMMTDAMLHSRGN